RTLIPVMLGAVVLCWTPAAPAEDELPKAVQEVLKQYVVEAAGIEKKVEPALKAKRDKATAELKKIQDALCKEAKLDEAVAVRDLIRDLQAGAYTEPAADLPAAVRDVL